MSKEKIFAILSAREGEFLSGEAISEQLGISRAAVWKGVSALRRDGYTIEAQTGLGYRLAASPDALTEREVLRHLGATQAVGRTLYCFERVDSTNSFLKRAAAENAPDGAVAVADEQTAGRGRRGRSFSSGPGRGVYLSALLRPKLPPERLLPLTALGAVAACNAVERTCGVRRNRSLPCWGCSCWVTLASRCRPKSCKPCWISTGAVASGRLRQTQWCSPRARTKCVRP